MHIDTNEHRCNGVLNATFSQLVKFLEEYFTFFLIKMQLDSRLYGRAENLKHTCTLHIWSYSSQGYYGPSQGEPFAVTSLTSASDAHPLNFFLQIRHFSL